MPPVPAAIVWPPSTLLSTTPSSSPSGARPSRRAGTPRSRRCCRCGWCRPRTRSWRRTRGRSPRSWRGRRLHLGVVRKSRLARPRAVEPRVVVSPPSHRKRAKPVIVEVEVAAGLDLGRAGRRPARQGHHAGTEERGRAQQSLLRASDHLLLSGRPCSGRVLAAGSGRHHAQGTLLPPPPSGAVIPASRSTLQPDLTDWRAVLALHMCLDHNKDSRQRKAAGPKPRRLRRWRDVDAQKATREPADRGPAVVADVSSPVPSLSN